MKKIVLFLAVFILSINTCLAEQQYDLQREAQHQKRVMEIGFRVLNANQIDKRMTFLYSSDKTVGAFSLAQAKMIVINKGILPLMDSDEELAAVICHEIVHGIDFHAGLWRRLTMGQSSIAYETKADKKAIDLMVTSGYNPVAMILILNKICEEPNWFERLGTHPTGIERLNYIYEYIYAKYPSYLADNEYKNNLYFQNYLLNSKQWRGYVKAKYQDSSTTPVNNKTKK